MNDVQKLVAEKKTIIEKYSKKDDAKAATQLLTTIVPYLALWYVTIESLSISWWLTAACIFILCLFLLRVFVLMHECGHNSLFATTNYNKMAGFLLGVICGMPQYVWSKNHAHHHATNGNWDQYRGPLATLSLDEFGNLSKKQQTLYEVTRNIAFAPIAGFLYLIFNPRYNWIKSNIALCQYLIQEKRKTPDRPIKDIAKGFKSRCWRTDKEYRHMSANNLVLLSVWLIMSLLIGPAAFFSIYIISLSLSGAGGIILFTVQHNFEDSLAANTENWNYDAAAIEGTSFLVIPAWLNWFTANIAYHHIHHLSVAIPNYHLKACHEEYSHLFDKVTRISLADIPAALKNNLWDIENQRITSIAYFRRAT